MTVQGGFYEWYLEGMAEGRADIESMQRQEAEEKVAQAGYQSCDCGALVKNGEPHDCAEFEADGERIQAEYDGKPFVLLDFIMAYEGGELDEEEIAEGFQHLIDSGLAWTLQGSYGRTAAALIEAGLCHA